MHIKSKAYITVRRYKIEVMNVCHSKPSNYFLKASRSSKAANMPSKVTTHHNCDAV
jgi:hypothetical protein